MTGNMKELLSILFAISALAVIAGVLPFSWGGPRPPIYLLGMLSIVVSPVGYADWNVSGTVKSLLGLEDTGHDHTYEPTEDEEEEAPLQSLIVHLIEDPLALMSKTSEVLLLLVLSVLYYIEMARSVDECGCYPMKYLSKQ